jgi:hypothetical protein
MAKASLSLGSYSSVLFGHDLILILTSCITWGIILYTGLDVRRLGVTSVFTLS